MFLHSFFVVLKHFVCALFLFFLVAVTVNIYCLNQIDTLKSHTK